MLDEAAARAVRALAGRSVTTAESLTAGYVSAALGSVAGVSAVLRGGVVAYTPQAKRDLLGVDAALLAAHGTVHPEVARQMARGARTLLRSETAVATTGVAGPGPAEGHPAGTAFICVALADRATVRALNLQGGRESVRTQCALAALQLLAEVVEQNT